MEIEELELLLIVILKSAEFTPVFWEPKSADVGEAVSVACAVADAINQAAAMNAINLKRSLA